MYDNKNFIKGQDFWPEWLIYDHNYDLEVTWGELRRVREHTGEPETRTWEFYNHYLNAGTPSDERTTPTDKPVRYGSAFMRWQEDTDKMEIFEGHFGLADLDNDQ